MYAVFYSLYMALFTGNWLEYTGEQARAVLGTAWADAVRIVTNALGGSFETAQEIATNTDPEALWASVLALVTLTGLCLLVWKLTKYIFGIFFGGWSR